jgi:hypothetical protein
MNPPKICAQCEREPATHGVTCQLCHAVMLAVVTIRADWSPGEYATLGSDLRRLTFKEFTAEAIGRGASTAARLGAVLTRLVPLSGRDEMSFKAALFSELTHEAGELAGLAKLPGGLPAWRARVWDAMELIHVKLTDRFPRTRPQTAAFE